MVENYEGDIFTAPVSVILQSCNCFHTMGSGIAKEIKVRYPRAYQADCLTPRGDRKKLGQFSLSGPADDQPFWICNIYSQFNFGRDKRYVEYDKFYECMENVKNWLLKMEFAAPVSVGIPYKISSVNAGGDWEKIQQIIRLVFEKEEKIKILVCKKENC